jgi:plastocyanin
MRSLVALTLTLALAAPPAAAGDLAVQVRADNGKPVADAVVTLHLADHPTPLPHPGGRYHVDQRDVQFQPFVLVVPVNSDVAFPNFDPIRHHVYSFSPAKRFELKLYAREQSHHVHFDKPGVVALGCNIHDQMTAFLNVVDTPWAGKTDASGQVVLHGAPAGAVTVAVWHPYLRAPGNRLERSLTLAATGTQGQTFTVSLRPPPPPMGGAPY